MAPPLHLPGWLFAATLALAGCQPATPGAPAIAAEPFPVQTSAPKDPASDACWADTTLPAVIETVTHQKQTASASYTSTAQARIVQDRATVWFQVPCPAMATPDFWASVQRALKARGVYQGAVTGQDDAATGQAIQSFQAQRGLNSAILSLAAAQSLGLAPVPLDQLQ